MQPNNALSARPEPPAVFSFPETGQSVRTITIDAEPWFVAADVCAVLGLGNPSQAVTHLDDDEVQQAPLTTNEGSNRVLSTNLISEPGLYSLILRSRKPQARAFKRWVTHEVLPSIRKTGTYSRELSRLELIDMARAAELDRIESEHRAVTAETKVAELAPKAEAHDTYLVANNGERLVREVAKLLGWREKDLRAFLLAQRLLFTRHAGCGQTQYDVYSEHRTRFRPVEHVVTHGDAGPCSHYTIYVLPSGIELIRQRISRHAANELEASA